MALNQLNSWWNLFRENKKKAFIFFLILIIGFPLWKGFISFTEEIGKKIATIAEEPETERKIKPFNNKTFGILIATFTGSSKTEKENGLRIQHSIVTTINALLNKERVNNSIAVKLPLYESHTIRFHQQARDIGEKYNAKIVLWGDNTLNRIIPNITIVSNDYSKSPILNNIVAENDFTILDPTLAYESIEKPFKDIKLSVFTDDILSIALSVVGMKYMAQREYHFAISYFYRAINEKNNDDELIRNSVIYDMILRCYLASDSLDPAIPICEKIINLNFDDEDAYHTCGFIYDRLKLPDQALKYRLKAFSVVHDLMGYINLAQNYRELKNYKKAIELYTKSIDEYDYFPFLYTARGDTFIELSEDNLSAIKDYSDAINICEKRPGLFDNEYLNAKIKRGWAYGKINESKLAILDFSDVIDIQKEHSNEISNIYKFRGWSYNKINEFDKAIYDFSKAVEIDPKNADAWYWKGIIHVKLNEIDLAAHSYKKAIKYSNNDKDSCKFCAQKKLNALLDTKKLQQ
ncbi:MAG: tetratricopeptide repeat protein [Desulfobacula sp.]|jgi:tetratricopeptide (TPR) repeat protein|nr:tetratricopeptide repeat protein [Desulfobacula sp.]